MTEIIAAVMALIAAVTGSAATIIAALRRVADGNYDALEKRVRDLETHTDAQDRAIFALQKWKLAARHYIATLRGTLADRGIPSPEPPHDLELDERRAP
mgnify:CR=1 FL=1